MAKKQKEDSNTLYTSGTFTGLGPMVFPAGFKGVEAARSVKDAVASGNVLSSTPGSAFGPTTYTGKDKAVIAGLIKQQQKQIKNAVGGATNTGEPAGADTAGYPKVGTYTAKGNSQPYLGNPLIDPSKKGSVHYSPNAPKIASSSGYSKEKLMANIDAMEQQGASQQEIQEYLNSLGGSQQQSSEGYNPKPFSMPGAFDFSGLAPQAAPQKQGDQSFLQDVGQTLTEAGSGVSSAASRAMNGEINPLSGVLQGAGAIAGGVTGLTDNALSHAPIVGGIYKGVKDVIGKGVEVVADTDLGKNVAEKYGELSPETRDNLRAGFDIATTVPVGKAFGIAKKGVSGTTKRVLLGKEEPISGLVSPKMTAKDTAEAIQNLGTKQQGLLRKTVLNPNPTIQDLADTVSKNVPKLDASKGLLYNIDEVQSVVDQMGRSLKQNVIKQGEGRIYSQKELASRLSNIERPLLISSEPALNNAYNQVIKKALEITKSKGGKVSNLLDARQEFDAFVKKQFPNLYSSEKLTPMRQAVKDIRNEITQFTADNLPENVALRESLLTQHKLITAIENMAERAASGAENELGSNLLTRFLGRHRLIKNTLEAGADAAVKGTGVAGALRLFN